MVQNPLAQSLAESSSPSKSVLSTIANTKSWFQFYGDGFSIRIPPQFEDIMEPEDYSAGMALYGDKAKPKTFAARFHLLMGILFHSKFIVFDSSILLNHLVAQFELSAMAGGATLYSARTVKIKEEEGYRTYYFYEQHVALVAAVNSGKAIIAGATAPQSKWEDDGVKLRSAVISLTLL
ncbi:hypothetical protein Peur_012484 [Populus x canadensis]